MTGGDFIVCYAIAFILGGLFALAILYWLGGRHGL